MAQKLSNRAEARVKIKIFDHVTFDGALQLECMSSDESDAGSGALRSRGYQWRSTRLKRFYGILDDEDKMDRLARPRRGVGKKERYPGPPKDEWYLPPKGIATWMISKQWVKASQIQYSDLPDALAQCVDEPGEGFDWNHFDVLGPESDSDEPQTYHHQQTLAQLQHRAGSTSNSLNYAIV